MPIDIWLVSAILHSKIMSSLAHALNLKLQNQDISSAHIVIFSTAWHKEINDALNKGAIEILSAFTNIKITHIEVPGAVELAHAIKQYDNLHKADIYIAFGAVIQGATPHFDYVCEIASQGILQLNLQLNAAVIFGVLTLNSEKEAWERLGGEHGHKGKEAAISALQMLYLKQNNYALKNEG